jgi:APA family basic amino acid/polyamine antiporter
MTSTQPATVPERKFKQGLGLYDSTMLVAGCMIGSGIFLVTPGMARQLGSSGWVLLSWVAAGILTVLAALSYGELAGMMPRAGGQYVYLRESYSPLVGFLFGWTLFLVIQTGMVAAVAVGFARYLGTLWPAVSETRYLVPPIHIGRHYAVSLSSAQLVAIIVILCLTWVHTRGLEYGRLVQNVFTVVKIGSLLGLIAVGIFIGANWTALHVNFSAMWTPHGFTPIASGVSAATGYGLFVAFCVSLVGSLFASDAWNNITFTAGEVKNPGRNIPLSLIFGAGLVIVLYLFANLAYFFTLPLSAIQAAPSDRVATTMLRAIFPRVGVTLMALAIMISTFGCMNGILLAGARAYYAMAKDGLFFRRAGELNARAVPGYGLVVQGIWAALLVIPLTYDSTTNTYGNLYGNLLNYVISAELIFYILTIAGVFVLRRRQPGAERSYRTWGYPVTPAVYIAGATVIFLVLLFYQTSITVPGLIIIGTGVPVYFWMRRGGRNKNNGVAQTAIKETVASPRDL